jgi:hypothetical protein
MQLVSQRLVLALAVACAAVPASAELAAWDQARVTSIAADLSQACEAWWQATRRQVEDPGEAMDQGTLVGKARVLQEMSASLASHLKEGKGYDKTHNEYRSMKEIVDDTEVMAQQTPLEEPMMDAWAKVADGMRRIAPYYDPNANAGK